MYLVKSKCQIFNKIHDFVNMCKSKRNLIIRDRIRTCNLSVRSRTRYPLRHWDLMLEEQEIVVSFESPIS